MTEQRLTLEGAHETTSFICRTTKEELTSFLIIRRHASAASMTIPQELSLLFLLVLLLASFSLPPTGIPHLSPPHPPPVSVLDPYSVPMSLNLYPCAICPRAPLSFEGAFSQLTLVVIYRFRPVLRFRPHVQSQTPSLIPHVRFVTFTLSCEYCSFHSYTIFFLDDWTNIQLYSAFSFFSM